MKEKEKTNEERNNENKIKNKKMNKILEDQMQDEEKESKGNQREMNNLNKYCYSYFIFILLVFERIIK